MIEPEKVFGNLITFYINLIVDGRAGRARAIDSAEQEKEALSRQSFLDRGLYPRNMSDEAVREHWLHRTVTCPCEAREYGDMMKGRT